MSGNCEEVESWRGRLGDCIDSLHDVQQLLFSGHVISDCNSFAESLNKLRGITADLSRVIVARTDCRASEMIDLTRNDSSDDTVDEFDSMMCDMNDEEFDNVVNSQPLMTTVDLPPSNGSMGDIPSPCQQHVDKLKQVFGHSQFKRSVITYFIYNY